MLIVLHATRNKPQVTHSNTINTTLNHLLRWSLLVNRSYSFLASVDQSPAFFSPPSFTFAFSFVTFDQNGAKKHGNIKIILKQLKGKFGSFDGLTILSFNLTNKEGSIRSEELIFEKFVQS